MRVAWPSLSVGVGVAVTVVALSGCQEKPAEPPPPVAPTKVVIDASKRPPHPSMATAAYGEHVLQKALADAPVDSAKKNAAEVLSALFSSGRGSAADARTACLRLYQQAATPEDKGLALSLYGAAAVLAGTDKAALTDAAAVALLAATHERSNAVAQSARAYVAAMSGLGEQANDLAGAVRKAPHVDEDAFSFLALTSLVSGASFDTAMADVNRALAHAPDRTRLRALRMRLLLDVGDTEGAQSELDKAGGASLVFEHGRVLLQQGKAEAAIKALMQAKDTVDDVLRGEVLTELGRALLQVERQTLGDARVEEVIAELSRLPGYAPVAGLLSTELALVRQNTTAAAQALSSVQNRLPLRLENAWRARLELQVCAAQSDAPCAQKAFERALHLDGDAAAVTALLGTETAAADAARLAPFGGQKPGCGNDAGLAQRVRVARRAIARGGRLFALEVLSDKALSRHPSAKTCAVVQAVKARAAVYVEAVPFALAALKAERTSGPLANIDLEAVIYALGAMPSAEAQQALANIARTHTGDAGLQKAVRAAQQDHADPDARKKREAADGDNALPDDMPGTAPRQSPTETHEGQP